MGKNPSEGEKFHPGKSLQHLKDDLRNADYNVKKRKEE